MKRVNQKAEVQQHNVEGDPSPLHISPVKRGDRLARVKEWVGRGHAPKSNLDRYRLADRIAAVVAQTYSEWGDGAPLPDDIALMRIRELLLDLDKGIIRRHRRRRSV